MAFTGTPVFQMISDRICRITGLTLAAATAGTIGLFGHTGSAPDVTLPEQFKPEHYAYLGTDVPFAAFIDATVKPVATLANFSYPSVGKAGVGVADFRITVTNTFSTATSPSLEIYVKMHD